MKTGFSLVAAFTTVVLLSARAQEPSPASAGAETKAEPAAPVAANKSPEDLAREFITTLTNATLTGRWCFVKDGKMGPDRDENYRIKSVERKSPDSDTWTVNASFRYAGLEISIPVPLQVKWAGDTPVMIVDNIGIPGGNKYSARVMIYGNTYSGTWTGGEVGGLLHGVITNEAPADK